MRLIDADAIKIPSTYVDMFENCRNCKLLDEDQVREIIENAPTIEPKRGEWNKPNYGQCSNCRGWAIETENGYYFSDFCPNCGARMKGADDE